MPNSNENKESVVKCRNCGCSCTSNFCPDCGQSVKEKRLENRTFFIGLISGLSRINRGFVSTAWQLLVHPWKVIRDYIQCRRIRYTPPITILILVCFINTVVLGIISPDFQPVVSDIDSNQIPFISKVGLYITNLLMNNPIAHNLTIYIPALLAIPIVYGKTGAGRYNLAEYITAMIYMATAFLLFSIILSPLSIVSESWYSGLETAYSIIISSISMYKAFPMASAKRRIGCFILYLVVTALIYLLFLLLFGLIMKLGMNSI